MSGNTTTHPQHKSFSTHTCSHIDQNTWDGKFYQKNKIKEKRQRRVTSSQGNKWNSKTETNNLSFSTLVNFIWRNFFVLARNIIIIYLAKNSDGSVKYMVHNGPCLVTGYRRLFLFFFSFYFCQPLFFILNNDLVTLGLSSVISSPAAYRQFTAVHCRFWRRHFYFSCFCFFSLLPHLSHHLHGHWDLWISKVGPLSKRSLQHHNRIRELTL